LEQLVCGYNTSSVELKKYDGRLCVVLELVPLQGENKFKPHPQNRILAGSSQNFPPAPMPFLYGSPFLCRGDPQAGFKVALLLRSSGTLNNIYLRMKIW